jgi:signal transduction histidine kinase
MENAIKFTDDGEIELGFKLNDNEVQICVKDTGTGINKDDLDKVFSRFYQENKELSKHKGGLGLGLSIAKENIELLGGNITVQSIKGRGSTFIISLPFDNSKK